MYMFVVECVVVCHGGGVSWWWCVGGMGGGGGGGIVDHMTTSPATFAERCGLWDYCLDSFQFYGAVRAQCAHYNL